MKTHPLHAVEYKKTLTGVELIDVELQKVVTAALVSLVSSAQGRPDFSYMH